MTLESGFFTKIQHLYTFVLVTFCVADGLMKGFLQGSRIRSEGPWVRINIFEPIKSGLASGQSCHGHIANQNHQFLPLRQLYDILRFFGKTFDSRMVG